MKIYSIHKPRWRHLPKGKLKNLSLQYLGSGPHVGGEEEENTHVTFKIDVSNAFNELSRVAIRKFLNGKLPGYGPTI